MDHTSRIVRLVDAYDDRDRVWKVVTDGAPYSLMMSLAGYAMSTGDHAAMPWFRKYWAIDGTLLEQDVAAEFHSGRFLESAAEVTGTQHVVPYQMMVNLMGPMDVGAAHLDTPTFRAEPLPLWLRLEMGASGRFERWRIPVCGAVSWFAYEGPGGEYEYWPDGPHAPSRREGPPFGNVAVFGDNDKMFHRVGAIGTPSDRLTPGSLSGAAQLHHRGDGGWEIMDGSTPAVTLESRRLRVSILWTAMCFDTAEDLDLFRNREDVLTIERVTQMFADDLQKRGERVDVPRGPADDREWVQALERIYPLPTFSQPD